MNDADNYVNSMAYEVFICRAFKTDRNNNRHKAHIANMTNLIDSEHGRSNVAHLPSFEKQLVQVKSNIDKAIDKFLSPTWHLKQDEKAKLMVLKSRLNSAFSSVQVLEIIDVAIDVTNAYKDK